MTNIDKLSIATIRSLCIDMINKAKSGHPGMALGSAPILYTLFTKHLVADPTHPEWINRDRFILSAGHASSLLYSLLHLSGYELSLDDLKNFRQLHSLTPGHPEFRHTKGVDATSGPLGQGIAMAVGMALAEESLRNNYAQGEKLVNHFTYCLCGDGCLQEGISQEAISFAGHQKLNKLILFYDANQVTLDGALDLSFSEDVNNRFIASGWNVIEIKDGNDIDSIDKAINVAKRSKDKPTLIKVNTIIGYGSSKQGTSKVHGSPLGEEDGRNTKVNAYGFDHEDFYIPEEVKEHFEKTFINRGVNAYKEYEKNLEEYTKEHKGDALRFNNLLNNDASKYIPNVYPDFVKDSVTSTRVASGKALNDYMLALPNLIGGSADLASSVMTKLNGGIDFTPKSRNGHNINFGIREFAMAAIQNGILLHGGLRTYIGGFFVFVDYLKPALRMAALMKLPAIYLFSHDSIAVGEDGPTHQPIEQLAMLRSIPGVQVIRPCDERETYAAWNKALLTNDKPTILVLSRQNLPLLETSSAEGLAKGAYIISKEESKLDLTLIATGSEVSLAIASQKKLKELGIDVRVVSMPSWELFNEQDKAYQDEILGVKKSKRISIEMLSTFGWDKWADHHLGIDDFGGSAPNKDSISYFVFDFDHVVNLCKEVLR